MVVTLRRGSELAQPLDPAFRDDFSLSGLLVARS